MAEGDVQKALGILEEGLKMHPTNELMWLNYLRLKLSEVTSDSDIHMLYHVFPKARSASGSYAVILEVSSREIWATFVYLFLIYK